MNLAWITVKEAAARAGYHHDYFRRVFLSTDAPMFRIRVIEGPTGGRRILVCAEDIEAFVQSQIRVPATNFIQ